MTTERRSRPKRKQPRPNLRRADAPQPSSTRATRINGTSKKKSKGKRSKTKTVKGKSGTSKASRSRLPSDPTVRVPRVRPARPVTPRKSPASPPPLSPPTSTYTRPVRHANTARQQAQPQRAPVRITAKTIVAAIFSARVLSFVLLISCLFTLGLSLNQPGLYLNQFDVQGTSYLNPSDIITESNLRGAHIFTADPDTALAQIRALPSVVSADLSINWPGTAMITIEEETPIALWEQDGIAYWVNEAGHLIPLLDGSMELVKIRVDDTAENNLPITVPDEFDGTIDWPAPRTRLIPTTIIAQARDLAAIDSRYDVLIYSSSYGLTWYHPTEGWHVYFGTKGDVRVKAAVLEEILLDMEAKEIPVRYIDVSNPEMVRVMPVSGTADTVTVISSFQP